MNKFIFLIFIFFDTTIILSQDFSEKYYKFEGDSIYTSQIELDEITIYKPVKLESDKDLIMYYTLKRKTLKVYPYAKMASERLNKLNLFFDHIVDSEVYLKIDRVNTKDNKIVEIKLNIPGKELFAKKQCKSFEEATDESIEALRRQLKRHKGKLFMKS